MSRVPLHAAAAAGQPASAGADAPAARTWLTPAGWVILAATVLALGLRLLELSRPGQLLGVTEYDDGVYFGAAVRLVHGVVPYRDFILVQPPGIILLMSPVAALSKVIGTAWGMGVGRLLTACAGAASVTLAGLLVRRRGLLAVIITCGILAVHPDSIMAARTVLQEPWVVLFCLAGLLAVFDGDQLATSGRRLAWGGSAFGFAGAIKLWAIFPIVVIAVLCARAPRRAAINAGGAAAGFLVPVLPFAILAPSSFWRGVVVAQLVRVDATRVPLSTRLANLSGIASTNGTHGSAAGPLLLTAAIVLVVVISCVAASRIARTLPPPLEWFALATAGLVLVSFLWPVDFYYHYAAFFAPFLALAVALPVGRLVSALQQSDRWRSQGFRLDRAAAGVAAVAILAMFVSQVHAEAVAKGASVPTAAARVIPAGACVLTDQVSMTIAAGRFLSAVPGCSQMVDGDGTDLSLSRGRNGVTGAGRTPAVRAAWQAAFQSAQYVWLSSGMHGPAARRIAWTPTLKAYFAKNFRSIAGHPRIYRRVGLPGQ